VSDSGSSLAPRLVKPVFAGLHAAGDVDAPALLALAQAFSPRYERHGHARLSLDVSGLERMFGNARAIGEALRRDAAARGIVVQVATASTRTAALLLACARPGLTVVPPGAEAAMLASLPLDVLTFASAVMPSREPGAPRRGRAGSGRRADEALAPAAVLAVFRAWGLRTLGELAVLPSADLAARIGKSGGLWQAIARGDDVRPLVPEVPEERFDASIDLEWPIEGLEPLSFVLTRLLEPLTTRLERRDRAAAVLHVRLDLVPIPSTDPAHADVVVRSLQLPMPLRDVRALRTLVLLDLESRPLVSPIERVTLTVEPTPGKVVQHALFARAHPTPEQISTLLARLGALMGQDRLGSPATVDTYRPGAFTLTTFAPAAMRGRGPEDPRASIGERWLSVLRRCPRPVPARVMLADGRPVRVTTDRQGFAGGAVRQAAGPWRASGEWWTFKPDRSGGSGRSGESERLGGSCGDVAAPLTGLAHPARYDRTEWDVALADGGVYRVFQDGATGRWFIDGMAD
jgi:protein ImuB